MMPTRQGSFRLFRLFGIDVFLHWLWFIAPLYEINQRGHVYSSIAWNVIECLALFAIVLMHEFGHALACRQVGGKADQIVLWPLGGVAYVAPPQRPGAVLWSIAAGPLVNVALFPILSAIHWFSYSAGWFATMPNVYVLIQTIWLLNLVLLIFNLLPVYPLDGGQILRSLLWFPLGRAKSLLVATIIGFVGVVGLGILALLAKSTWFGILCVFILLNCWRGLMAARAMTRLAQAPRQEGYICPGCHSVPPRGAFWICGQCRTPFDTFGAQGVCPRCGAQYDITRCLDCGELFPMRDWHVRTAAPPIV